MFVPRRILLLLRKSRRNEPAGWANLGILAVRQQELDSAYEDLNKARSLAPDNSRIEQLLGDLESRRGKLPEAIEHLKRAVQLDKTNIKALYLLAEQTERQGTGTSDGEALDIFRKVLDLNPGNTAALLEVARLAAKVNNAAVLRTVVAQLRQKSVAWPDEAKQQMQTLRAGGSKYKFACRGAAGGVPSKHIVARAGIPAGLADCEDTGGVCRRSVSAIPEIAMADNRNGGGRFCTALHTTADCRCSGGGGFLGADSVA